MMYTLRFLLLLVLSVSGSLVSHAQSPFAQPYSQTPFQEEQEIGHPSDNAPAEGIHVSGEWTIVVNNPDGTEARRHSFKNALLPVGARFLAFYMAGINTAGPMIVDLSSFSETSPCTIGFCRIGEPDASFSGMIANTLDKSVPSDGENADRVVLQGTYTAEQDGVINNVTAGMGACTSDVAPDDCTGVTLAFMTGTSIAPIAITGGQIVQIEVVLGFN